MEMAIKFGDKYYPEEMTVEELVKGLEVENAFVFRAKKKKMPTAQEILEEC